MQKNSFRFGKKVCIGSTLKLGICSKCWGNFEGILGNPGEIPHIGRKTLGVYRVNIWDPCSKFSRSTYPEILIFCLSKMALEVSVPDSGISTFWIFFPSTCVLLNYTGKQLVALDL